MRKVLIIIGLVVFGGVGAWAQPTVTTTAADQIDNQGAFLNGTLTLNGTSSADVYFQFSQVSDLSSGVTQSPKSTFSSDVTFASDYSGALSAATHYYFRALADYGAGPSTVSGSILDFWTLSNPPSGEVSSSLTVTGRTTSQMDLSWGAPASNTSGYLILYQTGGTSPSTGFLSDGLDPTSQTYPAGVSHATATGTTTSITGLSPGTRYAFTIVAYNNAADPATYNYYTPVTGTSHVNGYTLSADPSGDVANLSTGTVFSTSIELTWDAPTSNTSGYVVLYDNGSTPPDASTILVDGTAPGAQNYSGVAGHSTVTSSTSTGNSVNFTSLSSASQYSFTVVPYNYDGSHNVTYNFLQAVTSSSQISVYTHSSPPSGEISNLTSSNITTSQVQLTWDAPASNTVGYIVLYQTGSTAASSNLLADGLAPGGQSLGGVQYKLLTSSTGSGNTLVINGLSAEAQYTFTVVPYNYDGTNSSTYNYLQGVPSGAASKKTERTLSLEPSGDIANLTTSNITASQIKLTWDAPASNTDGYVILYDNGASPAGTVLSDGLDPAGQTYGSVSHTVLTSSSSTGNTITLTSLSAETSYGFTIVPYNYDGTNNVTYNYLQSVSVTSQGSAFTRSSPPSGDVSNLTSSNITTSQIQLTWDAPTSNTSGYVVLYQTGSNPAGSVLSDGLNPAGQTYGSVSHMVLASSSGTGNTVTLTGLNPSTTYYYTVVPYNSNGTDDATYNYLQGVGAASQGNDQTDCAPPSSSPTFAAPTKTATTATLNFSVGAGEEALVVITNTDSTSVPGAPSSGNDYSGIATTDYVSAGYYGNAKVVYTGGSNASLTINTLDAGTNYQVDIYAYDPTYHCYNTTPASQSFKTANLATSSTITVDATAASDIVPVDHTSNTTAALVLQFTINDVGDDGAYTRLKGVTFHKASGDAFSDWSAIIAGAQITDGTDTRETTSINTSDFTIGGIPQNGNNRMGDVPDGGSKTFYVKLWFKTSLSASLKQTLDGKDFVLDFDASTDFNVDSHSTKFVSSAQSTGDGNNVVDVQATAFNILTQPAPTTIFAGDNFTTSPQLEAVDADGNRDLGYPAYVVTFSTTNTGGLNMQHTPSTSDVSNGILTFPSTFNYRQSGNGTLTFSDGTISKTFTAVTVNPSITLTASTNSLASSPLNSNSTDQVLMAIQADALGNANFTDLVVNTDRDPGTDLSNVRVYVSSSTTFSTGTATQLDVGSWSSNAYTFTGFSNAITNGTSPKYYYIVGDVGINVNASTPSLQLSWANTDASYDNSARVVSSGDSKTYSFKDVTPPTVSSVTPSIGTISDAEAGTTFSLTIAFSEDMDQSVVPVITFPVEDPATTIGDTLASSGWADATHYVANYTVTDAGVTLNNIDVGIANAQDISGNVMASDTKVDQFSIDTENPTLASSSLGQTLVHQPDKTLTITFTFSENMNTTVAPTVTVPSSTHFTVTGSSWPTSKKYQVTLTHDGTPEEVANAQATISGAQDVNGNVSVTGNTGNFTIDTKGPQISTITSVFADGAYTIGDSLSITVTFDQALTYNSGSPTLTLNTTASAIVANYVSTSGNDMVFSFKVAANENTEDLDVSAANFGGVDITDNHQNPILTTLPVSPNRLQDNKTIIIDTKAPTVASVSATDADGFYKAGDVLTIGVTYDEQVFVSGTPSLSLNSGGTAQYNSLSGDGKTMFYQYTIGAGENSADLDVTNSTAITLSGATIKDRVNINANNTLPTGSGNANALAGQKDIVVDTQVPALGGSPFSPLSGSFNIPLDQSFTVTLSEPVIGSGSANVHLMKVALDNSVTEEQTFDAGTVFNTDPGTATAGLSFTWPSNLSDSSSYYILIDAGAITDRAGNAFAGINSNSDWTFQSFGPARISTVPGGACVGGSLVINGKYFTGVTEVSFLKGSEVIAPSFTVNSDTKLTIDAVPANAGYLSNVVFKKQTGTPDNNYANVSTTSTQQVKVGPSDAYLQVLPSTSPVTDVCNDATNSVASTTFRLVVTGGSGHYDVQLDNGTAVNSYLNLDNDDTIYNVNPPVAGDNIYSLVSVTDRDPDINSCSAPSLGPNITIHEYERSLVQAGGVSDTIEVCLANGNAIDLSNSTTMNGVLPSITGDVTTGTWTIYDGPASGGGGFSSDFSTKTTTTVQPTYYPSLSDAVKGSITLKLTSDDPTGNNPCYRNSDFLVIKFAQSISANPGSDKNLCANDSVIYLTVSLGGGADGANWSRQTTFTGAYDNSWGFTDNPFATTPTYSLTSTSTNVYYKPGPDEFTNGQAQLQVEPTTTGSGCGGAPSPTPLNINILPPPTNTIAAEQTDVCVGEQDVRYEVNASDPNSTFTWILENKGTGVKQNQIDGANNQAFILVNWGDSVGTFTIKAVETNPSGCHGDTIFFTVNTHALPTTQIIEPNTYTFSNTAPLQRLRGEGGVAGSLTEGGIFYGTGVIQKKDGTYYFDPQNVGLTDLNNPSDVINVYFEYTDTYGCSSTDTLSFKVFDAAATINNLASSYCESDTAVAIDVNPSVIPASYEVYSFTGPGVTTNGINSGTFDPQAAADQSGGGTVQVTYNLWKKAKHSSTLDNYGSQDVTVNLLPTPAYEAIASSYCTSDGDVALNRNSLQNPGTGFSFYVASPLDTASQIITGDNTSGFVFHPESVLDYIPAGQYDALPVTIYYSYTDGVGCANTTSFTVDVYRQPDHPILDAPNKLICITGKTIPAVTVTNPVPDNNLIIRWFDNKQLLGSPVASGAVLEPKLDLKTSASYTYYVVQILNGCTSEMDSVTYQVISSPAFDWNSSLSSATDSINFYTTSTAGIGIDYYKWVLYDQNNNAVDSVRDNSHVGGNSSVKFLIPNPGLYHMVLTLQSTGGCSKSTSYEVVMLGKETATNQQFYTEDFEADNGGWAATGVNSSWVYGSPQTKQKLPTTGATKMWVTNLNGGYNGLEESYLYTPYFDLSGLDKPFVSFSLFVDVLNKIDGLVFQYSTDNKRIGDPTKTWEVLGNFSDGNSSGINWYNASGIQSNPGQQALGQVGWTGTPTASGMSEAKNILDDAVAQNPGNVVFRFAFRSKDNNNLPDGVAIDNFKISGRNRNILVESFSNANVANSQTEASGIKSLLDNGADFIWVDFHTDIPTPDEANQDNPVDASARELFYSVDNVPTAALDGNYHGGDVFSNYGENAYQLQSLNTTPFELQAATQSLGSGDSLKITITGKVTTNVTDSLVLQVLVVEKQVDVDGQTYYNVVRKMLPNASGTLLKGPFAQGSQLPKQSFVYKPSRTVDPANLAVVVFLQNENTKEVFQSIEQDVPAGDVNIPTGLPSAAADMGIQVIYPNPADTKCTIRMGSPLTQPLYLQLVNAQGKKVTEAKLDKGINKYELPVASYHEGIYILRLQAPSGKSFSYKLIIR